MHDPRTTRRLALFSATGLLVALACTCTNPLAGLRSAVPGGGIGDRVWFDANGNGLQDEGEEGLSDVEVRLVDETGNVLDSTRTDANGEYKLAKVDQGTYVVWFAPPEGMVFTLNDVGSDDSLDSDAIQASGQTDPFFFDGLSDTTRDAGLVEYKGNETPVGPNPTETPQQELTAVPEETSTPAAIDVHATYEHTAPGSYSEILIWIFNLDEGQDVSGAVTGPAVDGDGAFTITGDAEGKGEARVKIFQFGLYNVVIPDLQVNQEVNVVAATATPY